MRVYDNFLLNASMEEKNQNNTAVVPINMKYNSQSNTQRGSEEGHSIENRAFEWSNHELGRKEIIQKAELKPPSYFRLNLG